MLQFTIRMKLYFWVKVINENTSEGRPFGEKFSSQGKKKEREKERKREVFITRTKSKNGYEQFE